MQIIFATTVPVFILLMLGYFARRTGFLPDVFWQYAEKGTYFVLFPALLVVSLARAELDWQAAPRLVLAVVLLPVLASVLSLPFKWLLSMDGADFTSFFQGAVRFNTYIGLALASTLPNPAMTLAALLIAVMIPVVNVLCVLAFAVYTQTNVHLGKLLLTLLKNPLIIACLLGIALNLMPWQVPGVGLDVLVKLGQMALPMGLLAVGAGLHLQSLHAARVPFFWSSLLKLLVLPVGAWFLAELLGLEPIAQSVLVLFAALPTASSAYILARQLGGNATLMAGIITGQTLLGLLTLPLVLAFILP